MFVLSNLKNSHDRGSALYTASYALLVGVVALLGAPCLGCSSGEEMAGSNLCAGVKCNKGEVCKSGKCVAPSDDKADSGTPPRDAQPPPTEDGDTPIVPVDAEVEQGPDVFECHPINFEYTASPLKYTIPDNVKWMHVKAWAGGGNQEKNCPGGVGGYSEASFNVTPGTELTFIVGALGRAGNPSEFRLGFGRDGGSGLTGVFKGGEDISENDFNRALIIAGGGGGAGVDQDGNCLSGTPGNNTDSATLMQTMLGGPGGDPNVNGGGGGYKGGKGGVKGSFGYGGSGFISEEAIDKYMLTATRGSEDPPNTSDPEYKDNAGKYEKNGLLIVKFTCTKPEIVPPK